MAKINLVRKLTGGLLATATDLVLLSLFYGLEVATAGYGGLTLSGTQRVGERALGDLEKIKSKTLQRSLRQLFEKGLIKTLKEQSNKAILTSQGKQRLKNILPAYQKKRYWDGVIHAVTYDIPVNHNKDRNFLREFLRKIGCGLLQESVWITPYNPSDLIREFAGSHDLEGTILVSSLGKGGTIGSVSLRDLIERVYHLEELSAEYEEFVAKCDSREITGTQAVFAYLAILEKDPQLPFELLPEWWSGESANVRFCQILKEQRRFRRS